MTYFLKLICDKNDLTGVNRLVVSGVNRLDIDIISQNFLYIFTFYTVFIVVIRKTQKFILRKITFLSIILVEYKSAANLKKFHS